MRIVAKILTVSGNTVLILVLRETPLKIKIFAVVFFVFLRKLRKRRCFVAKGRNQEVKPQTWVYSSVLYTVNHSRIF